jgi:hypothetical protein
VSVGCVRVCRRLCARLSMCSVVGVVGNRKTMCLTVSSAPKLSGRHVGMASRQGVDRPMERSSRPVVGYGGTVSFRDNVCIGNWAEDRAAHAHASEVLGDSSSLATVSPH